MGILSHYDKNNRWDIVDPASVWGVGFGRMALFVAVGDFFIGI